jgi:hypothetical protein
MTNKEALEKELEKYDFNKSAIRAAINAGRYNNAARLLTPHPEKTTKEVINQINVRNFRNRVGYHMAPPPRYNNSKINLKKGSNAYAHIKRAWKNGKLTNMTVPHRSWIHRGAGLAPSTVNNALMNSTESWAFINRNTGNVRAFGLGKLSSPRNLRLKVFAAFPSYGSKLLNRIKENVNRIELSSVPNANKFYEGQGFTGGGFTNNYNTTWVKS